MFLLNFETLIIKIISCTLRKSFKFLIKQINKKFVLKILKIFFFFTGSRLRPKTLQVVDVPVVNSQLCEDWHRQKGINVVIYDEMMCAG